MQKLSVFMHSVLKMQKKTIQPNVGNHHKIQEDHVVIQDQVNQISWAPHGHLADPVVYHQPGFIGPTRPRGRLRINPMPRVQACSWMPPRLQKVANEGFKVYTRALHSKNTKSNRDSPEVKQVAQTILHDLLDQRILRVSPSSRLVSSFPNLMGNTDGSRV